MNESSEPHAAALAIIARLEAAGYELSVRGEKLHIRPTPTPDALDQVKAHRDAIYRAVWERTYGTPAPPLFDGLESLRRFCPDLWRLVRIGDGRTGLLWGVSPTGVQVALGFPRPILTLKPCDVALVFPEVWPIDES